MAQMVGTNKFPPTSRMSIYAPLNVDRLEIRLFYLCPGERAADIAGLLNVVSLKDIPGSSVAGNTSSPPYEALSYVWGNPNITQRMKVNGWPLDITTNLFRALLYLRDTTKFRRLWIDAICINQKDIDERAKQVTLMRSIYASAARVIVWIDLKVDMNDPLY
ncbi:heterokaryon incompatibility protein-domain-containing protein [Tricladium varicosporioides]|nr:heterokaryon incompatibility protein-domain-containing protein [Hymenoscyphus varicosporioides]